MNSALKPVLQGVPQTGGQGSPAKGNVAGVNHAGHPQGAQNSLNHGSNSLVGQNLTNHPLGAPPQLPHAAPSMAPVSANMAQMAQNMSHHGNLSHVTQNSGPVPSTAASPNKSATTSSPLSLVQDKVTVTPSQPLALTRTPEKKEADSVSQANGTVEPPKSGSPAALKPQNNDAIKEKPDIAKTSPSTPKPPEPKPSSAPSTPLKTEAANAVGRADTPAQSKVVTASEPPEKSPAKPSEPSKPAVAPTADVAPSQSDNKPAPESAKDSQEKALIPPKPEPAKLESAKVEAPKVEPPKIDAAKAEPAKIQTLKPETPKVEPPKVEQTKSEPSKPDIPAKVVEKKEEPKVDQSKLVSKPAEEKKDDAKVDTTDGPQKEATQSPKVEEKSAKPADTLKPVAKQVETPKAAPKPDVDTPKPTVKPIEAATKVVATKPSESPKPAVKPADTPKSEPRGARSTIKLATVTPTIRKRRHPSPKSSDGPTPAKKAAESESTPDSRMKRNRTKVQLYQSPTPELTMATKLSASAGRSTPTKPNDDKLIVFYKNEYLAVRNAEGSFYVCQALQNVYRSTRKIKIRWLSQDKTADASGETYKPDFYDVTDMECVLTTLSLVRAPSGCGAQLLKPAEEARAKSILQRAIKAEQSGEKAPVDVTEEHPDGLDLSLYKDESQLEKNKKGGRKRNSSKSSPKGKVDEDESDSSTPSPPKKSRAAPKRSPRSSPKKAAAAAPKAAAKRKPAGSTPTVAAASKTATAATEKASPKPAAKSTPAKRAPPKPAKAEPAHKVDSPKTPLGRGRRAAGKDSKPSTPITPTPSTSTGKSGRSQRKPPQHK